MSHTPTPWALAQSSNPKNGTKWRDLRAMGAFGEMYIGEALEQDAAHIIHCVNMHDALVAALKMVESCLAPEDNDITAQTVRKAIAKAEKGA